VVVVEAGLRREMILWYQQLQEWAIPQQWKRIVGMTRVFFAKEAVASTVESPDHDEEEAQVPTRLLPRREGRSTTFRAHQTAHPMKGGGYYGNEERHCLTGTIIVNRLSTLLSSMTMNVRCIDADRCIGVTNNIQIRNLCSCSVGNKEKSRSLRHSRGRFSDGMSYCDVR
jgi:hypothetical protein